MIQVSKLSWSDVEKLLDGATSKALEIGVPTNIAVVDEAGILLALKRMDGAQLGCVQIAIDKAYTAALLGVTTDEESKLVQPGKSDYGIHTLYGGRLTTIGGGLPIRIGGLTQILGGIGVSSGTVEQDIVTAEAGLNAFLTDYR